LAKGDQEVSFFPAIYVNYGEILNSTTRVVDYQQATKKSLEKIKEEIYAFATD